MERCEFCGKSDGVLKGDSDLGWFYHKACLDQAWEAEYGGMTSAEVLVAEGFGDLLDSSTVAAIEADTREALRF